MMKNAWRNGAWLLALCLIGTGCLKGSQEVDCEYDDCAVKAPQAEIQQVQDYLSAAGITNATQHCSGLFYIVTDEGSGRRPTVCNLVMANYAGRFTSGTQFEQNDSTQFYLNGGVIRGWANGLPLIKEGGSIRLFIPPALGYGDNDYNGIPGKSVLIFDVDLLKVY